MSRENANIATNVFAILLNSINPFRKFVRYTLQVERVDVVFMFRRFFRSWGTRLEIASIKLQGCDIMHETKFEEFDFFDNILGFGFLENFKISIFLKKLKFRIFAFF